MSNSENLLQEISDQLLTCKLCLERMKKPKTLSCLHSFCSKCLRRTSKSTYILNCPICKSKTHIPSSGISNLPENTLLSNLADVLEKRKDNVCGICQLTEAVSKCLECSKLLCSNCVFIHQKTRVTATHTVHKLGENVLCKVHVEENVRFYCDDCHVCICVLCAFQQHQSHEVSNLSCTIAKNVPFFHYLLSECRSKVNELEENMLVLNSTEIKLRNAEDSIQDKAFELIALIRQQQRLLTARLHSINSPYQVNQAKKTTQQTINSLLQNTKSIDTLLKTCGVELLLLKDELQKSTELLLQYKCLEPEETDVCFYPGKAVLGFLGNNPFENESIQTENVEKVCQGTQDDLTSYDKPDKLIQTADKSTGVNIQKLSKSIPCQTDISFNAVIMKIKEKFTVANNTVYQFRKRLIDYPEDEFKEEQIKDFSSDISQLNISYHPNPTNFCRLNQVDRPKILKDFSDYFDYSIYSNLNYTDLGKSNFEEKPTDIVGQQDQIAMDDKQQDTGSKDRKADELALLKSRRNISQVPIALCEGQKRPPIHESKLFCSTKRQTKSPNPTLLKRPNSLGTIRELRENSSPSDEEGRNRKLKSAKILYKAEPESKCRNIIMETPFGRGIRSSSLCSIPSETTRRNSFNTFQDFIVEETLTKPTLIDSSTNTTSKVFDSKGTNTEEVKDVRVAQCITKLTKVRQRLEQSWPSSEAPFSDSGINPKRKSSSDSSPFPSPIVRRRSKSDSKKPGKEITKETTAKARKKRVDLTQMLANEDDSGRDKRRTNKPKGRFGQTFRF